MSTEDAWMYLDVFKAIYHNVGKHQIVKVQLSNQLQSVTSIIDQRHKPMVR